MLHIKSQMTIHNFSFLKHCILLLAIFLQFSTPIFAQFNINVYESSCNNLSASLSDPQQLISSGKMVAIENQQLLNPDKIYWIHIMARDTIGAHVLSLGKKVSKLEVFTYPYNQQGISAGQWVAFSEKKLSGSDVLIEFDVQDYLVKLENGMHSKLSVHDIILIPADEYYNAQQRKAILHGIVQGCFWLMILFNTMFFMGYKKRIYLYYVLFVLCNSFYLFYSYGFSEQYIFPHSPLLNQIFLPFQLLGLIFYSLFLRVVFLEHCPSFNRRLDKLLIIPYCIFLLFVVIVMAINTYINMNFFVKWVAMVNIISGLVAMGCFILYFNKSSVFARYIAIGSVIMIGGGFITVCQDLFYQPSNILPYQSGLLLELIIFSYALNQLYIAELKKRGDSEIARLKLKNELSEKNRELVQKALQITSQAETLSRVKEILHQEAHHQTKESLYLVYNKLNILRETNMWNEFDLHFKQTHPDFYAALLNQYPDLTQNELKICAFLKLNLNSKEIASITQKSLHSIETMRSRVRKKMNLSRDANLFLKLSEITDGNSLVS
jgi:DNA-binding CsgD family transcriptional regulator